MIENTLFVCDCGDVDHQFIVSYDPDEDFGHEVIVQIHLADVGFWNRVFYGLRYIFGKRSRYNRGAFGEVLLNKEQVKDLIETFTKHYGRMS